MKCVIFELDGVLRDVEGNAIAGNVALAKSLYSAGHDVLIMRAKHAHEWLHANDVSMMTSWHRTSRLTLIGWQWRSCLMMLFTRPCAMQVFTAGFTNNLL